MDYNRPKAVFNWSGGKDSALALQKVLDEGEFDVIALLTTVNRSSRRSTMHAIPVALLEQQALSVGIPLYVVDTAPEGGIDDDQDAMQRAVDNFKQQGVRHFIFGDIFLHDVKSYRENQLNPHGITVVEPLWGKSSAEVMDDFLGSGLKTIVVTTMADVLVCSFIGRLIDRDFVNDLPEGVDVCGENGEYHTFCFDGRMFSHPVAHSLGTPISKCYTFNLDDGTAKDFSYWFADLRAIL